MYWFSAINKCENNLDLYLNYIEMYSVAVTTVIGTNPWIKPVLILDGELDEHTKKLELFGVTIFKFQSTLIDTLKTKYSGDSFCIAKGAFLRVDISKVCEMMNITDEYVLYTDNDVMFLDDVSEIKNLKCKYLMMCSEFTKEFSPFSVNTGVMLINLKNYKSIYNRFKQNIISMILISQSYDQDMFRYYFGKSIESLPYNFNYKPYWGLSDNIKILHFHGPKPHQKNKIEEFPEILNHLISDGYFEMCDLYFNILKKYKNSNDINSLLNS
jgi:hypothetical protein